MSRNFFSILASAVVLTASSISALADTYECAIDSIKISYQISMEDTKVDGTEMATFRIKALNETGDLISQMSGLASVLENYENNQTTLKSYILADRSELRLLTLDSQIKFIKKSSGSSGATIFDCKTKP